MTPLPESWGLIAKILLVPNLYFLLFILLPGLILLVWLQRKWPFLTDSASQGIFLAAALGLLYNALQFMAVLTICHFLHPDQIMLVRFKFLADLLLFIVAVLGWRRELGCELRRWGQVLARPRNIPVILLALAVGVLAVLRYPHVFDSGQLIQTNAFYLSNIDMFGHSRLGYGFSALVYFPGFSPCDIPLTTLAGGFKLTLLLLTGLLTCHVVDRLRLRPAVLFRLLFFLMLIGSIYGLYGLIELGKDSAWAVLFSLMGLVAGWRGGRLLTQAIFFAAAAAMGMIAIPFVLLYLAIRAGQHLLPFSIAQSRRVYWTLILLPLLAGILLMPVALPQFTNAEFSALGDPAITFNPPADGRSGFFRYYFDWQVFGYGNVWPVIAAGLLGLLLLPCLGRRFHDPALRSLALFPTAAAALFLLLALPARGWIPSSRSEHLPFLPLTPFDLWNLIKDLAQWYVQIVSAVGVLLLFLVVHRLVRVQPWRRLISLVLALFLVGTLGWSNRRPWLDLPQPATFLSRVGHVNPTWAFALETLARYPIISQCLIADDLPFARNRYFLWNIQHVVTKVKGLYVPVLHREEWIDRFQPRGAFLLLASESLMARFVRVFQPLSSAPIRRLHYDAIHDIGVYYFPSPRNGKKI